MYHIDCYVDKEIYRLNFFADVRSFALVNTNMDAMVDYNLFFYGSLL